MAETPMDIITRHLDLAVNSGDGAPDPVTLAVIINDELKQKFRITALAAPWEESAPKLPEGTEDITIRASGNPMLWYMGTDLKPYRLDDQTVPNSLGFPSGREAQLALALVDVSASRLHKVTR